MRDRKIISAVLIVAVVLGIVGCKAKGTREIVEDDIEITTTTVEAQKETTEEKEESTTTSETTTSAATSAIDTVTPDLTEPSVSETEETTPKETEPTKAPTKDPDPTEAPIATATPVPTDASKPTVSPVPTATPEPTATPTLIPTPTSEPTPFDIDKSAKEHGYEIIDIDMGNGQTERVYGYYVDMSGLDDKVNAYRESIGMTSLPKDTNHIAEMKIRAVEITIPGYFGHKKPNGHWGEEANIVSGTGVQECYDRLYASDGHRAAWEDSYATTIYSIGFRRMVFDETTGEWSGGGGATVQYFGCNI